MSTQPVQKGEPCRTPQIALNAVSATQIYVRNTTPQGDPNTDDIRIVRSMDAAIVMYMGADNTVTALTGFPLAPNESFILAGPSGIAYKGNLWMIAASGTPKVATFAA